MTQEQRPAETPAAQSAPPTAERTRRNGRGKLFLIVLIAIVVLVFGGRWIYFRYTHVHTDDARIDGEVVTVSSRVSGWITELNVIEGDVVKAGQVLARVDARDSLLQREVLQSKLKSLESQAGVIRAQSGQVDAETLGKVQVDTNRLAAAEAEVASLAFQLKQAQYDYDRARELTAQKWMPQQQLERARTAFQRAQEQHRKAVSEVAAARGTLSVASGGRRQLQVLETQLMVLARQADEIRAEIKRKDFDIEDRTIVSPSDGRIVMTFVRSGEHVSAGQRILMFHDPNQIWVEANIKETDVGLLEPGM
jgi:membrane fusion protein (multidrug efflux system)